MYGNILNLVWIGALWSSGVQSSIPDTIVTKVEWHKERLVQSIPFATGLLSHSYFLVYFENPGVAGEYGKYSGTWKIEALCGVNGGIELNKERDPRAELGDFLKANKTITFMRHVKLLDVWKIADEISSDHRYALRASINGAKRNKKNKLMNCHTFARSFYDAMSELSKPSNLHQDPLIFYYW